ncbi:unnamed protein product [Paramecium octaurelia]|uniref:Uncharacterized protein n=1 Tax=Paramecium octaurelia TaxID=43137 RepID=A0A8S1W4K4_PAROT|nr:unnamed protein product [Paramecium octaurelia]
MINNELNDFVKKAYQHNLLTPLMNKLRIRTQIVSRSINKDQNKKFLSKVANTSQNEKISQQKISDEDTERSSSKLFSSFLLRQERKNTLSPQKMNKILSNSKEEIPQQLADVFGEINRMEVESDGKLRCKSMYVRNIRINKQQLAKYLQRYYPDIICEQIVKVLKIPQILTFSQYHKLIRKIENLDLKQQIRVCFLFYDLNNQAEITTKNLIELLNQNGNPQIELDILHMIKQTKIQISNQINNDVKQILPSILPLNQSVILSQGKQSVVSNDGRRGQQGNVSQRNSLDFNIEIDQDSTSHSRNTLTKKKIMLITQINKEEQELDVKNIVFYKSERKKNKSKFMKDENKNQNKISIDLNKFTNIWYPQKPNLFNDLLRNLTSKP